MNRPFRNASQRNGHSIRERRQGRLGRIEHTQCCVFSADEGADVGADEGTPVTEDYQVPFTFTGTIDRVTIDLLEMKAADAREEQEVCGLAQIWRGLSD